MEYRVVKVKDLQLMLSGVDPEAEIEFICTRYFRQYAVESKIYYPVGVGAIEDTVFIKCERVDGTEA